MIYTLDKIIFVIQPLCTQIELVGSRITCDPPPVGTDQDVLVLTKVSKFHKLISFLEGEGYDSQGSAMSSSEFVSLKSEQTDINFIITKSYEYFHRFMAATSIAKRFNLLNKDDRVALFEAVIRGTSCDMTTAAAPIFKKEVDYLAITRQFF